MPTLPRPAVRFQTNAPNHFAAWLDMQVLAFRPVPNERYQWLADQLDAMARLARYTDAQTPAEYEERTAELERDAAECTRCEARINHAYAAAGRRSPLIPAMLPDDGPELEF